MAGDGGRTVDQLNLFPTAGQELAAPPAPVARSRRGDPASSHAAAERMVESGAAKHHEDRILDLLFIKPNSTIHELAALSAVREKQIGPLDHVQIARRLPEMLGVERGELRKCNVKRVKCQTWRPA